PVHHHDSRQTPRALRDAKLPRNSHWLAAAIPLQKLLVRQCHTLERMQFGSRGYLLDSRLLRNDCNRNDEQRRDCYDNSLMLHGPTFHVLCVRLTLAVSRAQWPQRRRSVGYWASAPLRC